MTASARQPSWGEVLDTVLTSRLRGVHTAMVGEIRSYSEAEQTAEVTLAVQLEAASGEFETLSPLADVPVAWPGAWAAGDTCLLVLCEEDFSKWWDTGSVEQPEVLRRHGLHAVCIPIVARAGQAVQFVALEPGVAGVLTDILTQLSLVVAALVPTTGVQTTPPIQTNWVTNIGLIAARIAAGEMAATKVKAR
jgi:hypothetical protein